VIGSPQSSDECLFTEDDDRFWLELHKARSDDFIVATSSSKITSETWLVPLTSRGAAACGKPVCLVTAAAVYQHERLKCLCTQVGTCFLLAPREQGVLHSVSHWVSGNDLFQARAW
jgi:protease II